jgi:RES domain-containing protein
VVDAVTLERILASGSAGAWRGRAFRVMLNDAPPDRENIRGARWNPPDTAAIYTCLEPSVCIAEVEYNFRRQPAPVKPDLRRTLYEIEVCLASVLDLGPLIPALIGLGIEPTHLHAEDMQVSQEIGRLVTWFGHDGLLVPSARKAGNNLVIYPGRAGDEYHFEVVSQQVL